MMRIASSLSNRIFIACTALALLSLGFAFYFVNARATAEAEAELRRGLQEASTLVDLRRENLTETMTTMARLVADLPVLKATVDLADPPTVQPLAEEYRQTIAADLLVITDPRGAVLGASGGTGAGASALDLGAATIRQVAEWSGTLDEGITFITRPHGILQVVSVPIYVGKDSPDTLGRLSVGFFMDDALATRFKQLTGSEVAFATAEGVVASSLPHASHRLLSAMTAVSDITSVMVDGEEYLSLARPMLEANAAGGAGTAASPVTLVLRSRTERLRFLDTIRAGLAGALVVTVLLATIMSYLVARTMTRPLAAVTSAMRDVAATGDLTRKVPVRSRAWDDEDARLLAGAFNTLTESIARFQRMAAQKERLSSLGRMSTVIAHEVRNPLMIIRASLSTLRRERVTDAELREAVSDIDEETMRLNRIVTEVLDFAKPVRFDVSEANLNDICRASAAAAWAGSETPAVHLDLDSTLPSIVTDSERLRTALVNILTNARHAVEAGSDAGSDAASDPASDPTSGSWTQAPQPVAVLRQPTQAVEVARPRGLTPGLTPRAPVTLRTERRGDRVVVTVRDCGGGIAPEELAHVFDPYFTTRRAGTGLGLPISKNIIEGLGGSIAVSSRRGDGTEVRIDLPLAAPEAAA
jgi:signal transduction histidine kinase